MQQQNPLLRIWGWGKDEHGGLIFAIVGALIGVALGIRHRQRGGSSGKSRRL